MVFSASSLMQALFLFTFSFVIFLLLSGLVVAIYRYQWGESTQDLKQNGNFLLVSLIAALGFCLLFSSFLFEFSTELLCITLFAIGVFSLIRLLSHTDFTFSFPLPLFKGPLGLPLWTILIALICLLVVFLYFGQSPFFTGHFPFWADRFLGALVLFLFTLFFDLGTKEPFGVQISFGLMALLVIVSVFTLPLSLIWLEFAFILVGLGLAALYWGICFAPSQFDKALTLSVGLWLGCMLLELMARGALYFPLLLLFLACCYYLYPSFRLLIEHFQKSVFKN
jgi:hypothetical protein